MNKKILNFTLLIVVGSAVVLAFTNIAPGNPLHKAVYGEHCNIVGLYNEQVAIGEQKRAELAASGSDGHSIGSVAPLGAFTRDTKIGAGDHEPTLSKQEVDAIVAAELAHNPNDYVGHWRSENKGITLTISQEGNSYKVNWSDSRGNSGTSTSALEDVTNNLEDVTIAGEHAIMGLRGGILKFWAVDGSVDFERIN